EPHEVTGVIEATLSRSVLGADPIPADQREHEIARCQSLLEHLAKVSPQGDVVDVHEYRAFAEPRYQGVEQCPRLAGGVLPAITDEDRCHVLLEPADCYLPQLNVNLSVVVTGSAPPVRGCRSAANALVGGLANRHGKTVWPDQGVRPALPGPRLQARV